MRRHQLILREREPRLNFGLNWGGVSCGMQVPVFETSTVHAQLNDACARLLAATVVVWLSCTKYRGISAAHKLGAEPFFLASCATYVKSR